MKAIIRGWYSKKSWLVLLLPLSYLYQLGFNIHKLCYTLGIKKKAVSPKPVIVIGNLTVGGTGKTPFTIALAKFLLKQGHKPGIVTRGYKGKAAVYPQWVTSQSDAAVVGDESLLIAAQTNCPVVVSPKRADAISLLLERGNCDCILSDDGLQHHSLQKDITIAIVDSDRKFGNGFCLPAGPLREPVKRLSHVDFVVYNGRFSEHDYSMTLEPREIYNLIDKSNKLQSLGQVHAVAAIGNPDRFFELLRQLGFTVHEHVFRDHHAFKQEDFSFCETNDIVIMTEKDAVKCIGFAKPNFWVLPIQAEICEGFLADFYAPFSRLSPMRERSAEPNAPFSRLREKGRG